VDKTEDVSAPQDPGTELAMCKYPFVGSGWYEKLEIHVLIVRVKNDRFALLSGILV
jgi:hypothetical protein